MLTGGFEGQLEIPISRVKGAEELCFAVDFVHRILGCPDGVSRTLDVLVQTGEVDAEPDASPRLGLDHERS